MEIEEPVPERYIKDSALDETKKVVKEVKASLKEYKRCFDQSSAF